MPDLGFCLKASYAFRELFFCQISRNSNERFLRKQFISTKTTSDNFLVKCACVAFNWVFTAKKKTGEKAKLFVNSLSLPGDKKGLTNAFNSVIN